MINIQNREWKSNRTVRCYNKDSWQGVEGTTEIWNVQNFIHTLMFSGSIIFSWGPMNQKG